MKVIGIAAVAKNGVMGVDSKLPWDIPEDMAFFRKTTREQIVIMGRKSFDAIVEVTGKPLPKRENAVISRNVSWVHEGARLFTNLEEAICFYQSAPAFSQKTIYVIGGAEIFRIAFPLMDEILLTEIEAEVPGNVYFPDYESGKLLRPDFKCVTQEPQTDFLSSKFRYSFNRYVRSSEK